MAIDQVLEGPWTRKHDLPGSPLIPNAPKILYPKSLEDLIQICTTRRATEHLKAAGSHWALSTAAISDSAFIETHDPNDQYRAMGRTIFDVVPGCLTRRYVEMLAAQYPKPFDASNANVSEGTYLVHFETGKRIYQLYSELDLGDDANETSLARHIERAYGNSSYLGPWAFETLGGAGGQTVFGALTTGTHGGDFRMGAVADSVMALHLVADGGKHYWIEPAVLHPEYHLTDDEALIELYGADRYGGRENFEIIRDDAMFHAVLVSVGRFGIVYSIVMRAVRQYSLHEERRLADWQTIKPQISNIDSDLYRKPSDSSINGQADNRFLQIAVCMTPYANFKKNRCGVTKRWNVPQALNPDTLEPSGRLERRGRVQENFNAKIQGPLFERAGNSFSYSPDPDNQLTALPANFLERACSNSDFMEGILRDVNRQLDQFAADMGAGDTLASVVAFGPGGGILAMPAIIPIIEYLKWLLDLFVRTTVKPRLGATMNDLKNGLLDRTDPIQQAHGLLVWQMIAYQLFEFMQDDLDFNAISYAVMDRHDYFDKSCNVNVDSIEVFFNATDPMLTAFVDALIAHEIWQEYHGKAFVGYVSLRFCSNTKALLGMERHQVTCAVEVAGLKDASGSKELIDYALVLCHNNNFSGIVHWGQRNESTMANIQHRFGDTQAVPGGNLGTWRAALSRITENGRLDGFSSDFTRRVGLEVVTPAVHFLHNDTERPVLGELITIRWNCSHNPPKAEFRLEVISPSLKLTVYDSLPSIGLQQFLADERGTYTVTMRATLRLHDEARQEGLSLTVPVP